PAPFRNPRIQTENDPGLCMHGPDCTAMKWLNWILMTSKRLIQLLKLSFSRWNQHKAPKLGAALAYYTVLSLAPLMVLTVAIAGFFFGAAAVRGDLEYQLRSEEHTSELQSLRHLVCRLLLEKN